MSGDVGIRKPDAQIYEVMLRDLGAKPEHVLYDAAETAPGAHRISDLRSLLSLARADGAPFMRLVDRLVVGSAEVISDPRERRQP